VEFYDLSTASITVRIILILGVFAAFAAAGRYVYYLLKYVAWGKGDLEFDHVSDRLRGFMTYVIGQARVIREAGGVVHLFIFWGFLILQLETIEYMVRAFVIDFHFSKIIGEPLYNVLLCGQDLMGFLVAIAIIVATVRRFIVRPMHVVASTDAAVINALIFGLMVTKFIANGVEIMSVPPESLGHDPYWTPFALLTGQTLASIGAAQEWLYHVSYWFHLGIVAFFANYIPRGKHLHLIGAMPNIFFRKWAPEGALYPIDMEDETVESYGVGQVDELSWKQLLDTYACTECGRCEHYCPAYNTGKPLNPMMIIHKVKDDLKAKGDAHFKEGQDVDEWPNIAGGLISREELWACTTCGACVANCPVFIEHVDTIVDMRRYLALMEADFSPEVSRTFRNMENNSNPWGISSSYRADWADGLDIPMMSELDEPPEYLFWVGCAGSFDDRQKKVTRSFAKILDAAGVSYAILGTEEGCTGDPARRIGNEYLYWMLATSAIETLNSYDVTKIVTACPHCYHTIAKEYPQLGGNYEVVHHTDLIQDLLATDRLRLVPSAMQKVTYHDSCYIGRWRDSYDGPRDILRSVPGIELQEMELAKRQSFCCGAGGGRMWMEEHEGKRVNIERTDQAIATDPDTIAVACPFCMTMFDDGLKNREAEAIELKDLAEIVAENLAVTEETEEEKELAAAE
jgi:Fe-S oxidoreductase